MKLKLKRQYSFHVPASGSGVSDEGWRDAGARHIAYWQLAKSQLNEFNFLFRGMKISVVIDWSPVIRSFERYYRVMGAIEEYQKTHSGPWFDKISEQFQQRHTKINCLVTVECQNADDARFPSTFLENVLYNVFLIMNLADPGSCEFYNSMIRAIGEATSPGERRPSELSTFGVLFRFCLTKGEQRRVARHKIAAACNCDRLVFFDTHGLQPSAQE